jgi:hypothetical protein
LRELVFWLRKAYKGVYTVEVAEVSHGNADFLGIFQGFAVWLLVQARSQTIQVAHHWSELSVGQERATREFTGSSYNNKCKVTAILPGTTDSQPAL